MLNLEFVSVMKAGTFTSSKESKRSFFITWAPPFIGIHIVRSILAPIVHLLNCIMLVYLRLSILIYSEIKIVVAYFKVLVISTNFALYKENPLLGIREIQIVQKKYKIVII